MYSQMATTLSGALISAWPSIGVIFNGLNSGYRMKNLKTRYRQGNMIGGDNYGMITVRD